MTLVEFQQYILRYLGQPMINVELDTEQLNDRVNDTLQLFFERHYDGVIESFYRLNLVAGEAEFTLPDEIMAITGIYTPGPVGAFDERILLPTNHELLSTFNEVGLANIMTLRMQLKTLESLYNEDYIFDFNATTHTLTLVKQIEVDFPIFLRVFKNQSLDKIENIYDNRWVKQMACAQCKKQWGTNITKYTNIPLPGGGTINGEKIYQDGVQEIEEARRMLDEEYNEPPIFFIG